MDFNNKLSIMHKYIDEWASLNKQSEIKAKQKTTKNTNKKQKKSKKEKPKKLL